MTRSESARQRREAAKMAKFLDRVTLYVIDRSEVGKRNPPPSHVSAAARIVRHECDPAALEIVLDWICSCRTRAPSRVVAAAWDLGGPILSYWYPKNGHLMVEHLKRTA